MDHNLYSNVQSQQLHLQNQRRDYTAEENGTEEDDDSVMDPHYEFFLENLRPNGKSYVLDIPEDNVFVKYHDESSTSEAVTDCEIENANHVSNAIMDTQMHPPANYKGKRRGRKPKEVPKLHDTKIPNGINNHVASETHKHAGKHRVKRARKNVVPSSVETACFSQTKGQNSLDHGKKVNHTDTPPPCIATRVKEENEDYDDDAPPSITRPVQDPVLNVEHFWDNDEANARKLTKYREKLIEELKMPYCEEEYERLLKDITVRKPVQGKRELRRIRFYEENYAGKSFLDHHIDLKKKIDSARDDHPKVLNLLRGFFYWLKNLSHEGAFMPWRDPSCLDVLS